MNSTFTEEQNESRRREFLASRCQIDMMTLGDELAAYGKVWFDDVKLVMGQRGAQGFSFYVNDVLIEVEPKDDTIVCKLHSNPEGTVFFQRQTKPYHEHHTLDDIITPRVGADSISGWYHENRLLQHCEVLRSMIDTALGDRRSRWFIHETNE